MLSVRRRDTAPELALRSTLHRSGYRFFVDRRPIEKLNRRADIVFPRIKLAVFVDGCFWHGCHQHRQAPRSNADWWSEKIARVRKRDAETEELLVDAGWYVIRVWEHDDLEIAVARIAAAVVNLRLDDDLSGR